MKEADRCPGCLRRHKDKCEPPHSEPKAWRIVDPYGNTVWRGVNRTCAAVYRMFEYEWQKRCRFPGYTFEVEGWD